MKASVQYDDFVGSSAADISDHANLNEFLQRRGVDIERYEAIGASFYAGYEDYFSGSIICVDKQKSTESKSHIVAISFENELSKDDFFALFKRFNAVVLKKHDQSGQEFRDSVDEEITFDDREEDDKD